MEDGPLVTASPAGAIAPERSALNDWAVLVDAMAAGDIIALVRKGGIREQRGGFSVRHQRFLLYPTYFHERESELAPRFLARLAAAHASRPPIGSVRFSYVAEAVASWRVERLASMRAIEGEHGLAWNAVESRFHYRDRPGLSVVAVRVSRLARETTVAEVRRYGGCVSWVELDDAVDVAGAEAVLPRQRLAARVAALTRALGAPADA